MGSLTASRDSADLSGEVVQRVEWKPCTAAKYISFKSFDLRYEEPAAKPSGQKTGERAEVISEHIHRERY